MTVYCESSFFVGQALPCDHQEQALEVASKLEEELGFIPISSFCKFEVIQAFRFEAWRYSNDRRQGFPLAQVDLALNAFLAQAATTFQVTNVRWQETLAKAESLTRDTPTKGWQTHDILHVAIGLIDGAKAFYSFDQKQNELAASQGFDTPLRK